MSAKPKTKPAHNYNMKLAVVAVVLLVAAAAGWVVYRQTAKDSFMPSTTSRVPYVDGDDAAEQVGNFYRQYIASADKPEFQKILISGYGDQNLVFYDEYYQHGFDPITCSVAMPTKVTASLVSTGPVAVVNAFATYPDSTRATMKVRVTLSDKLGIDSITCPDPKGNLPPAGA